MCRASRGETNMSGDSLTNAIGKEQGIGLFIPPAAIE